MPEPTKKMKPCPYCEKDMEVGGICEACKFDDGEAEKEAWQTAYVSNRAEEIRKEMADKRQKAADGDKEGKRKKRGLFGS